MSYKVELIATDLDWQIQRLKLEPKIANSHLYPAMNRVVRAARTAIGSFMTFKNQSGRTRATFGSKVSGQGVNITGRVGWFGKDMPWSVNVLEYGARPHAIGYVPTLKVRIDSHPGIPPMKFVERGYQLVAPQVEEEMQRAADEITRDLAVR